MLRIMSARPSCFAEHFRRYIPSRSFIQPSVCVLDDSASEHHRNADPKRGASFREEDYEAANFPNAASTLPFPEPLAHLTVCGVFHIFRRYRPRISPFQPCPRQTLVLVYPPVFTLSSAIGNNSGLIEFFLHIVLHIVAGALCGN